MLRSRHAFNPRPEAGTLGAFYVPVEPDETTEDKIETAVVARERLAVIGPSGGGKSSVLQYVLSSGRKRHSFAPIWVSVLYEDDATLTDPRRFAQTLAITLIEEARTAELLLKDQSAD